MKDREKRDRRKKKPWKGSSMYRHSLSPPLVLPSPSFPWPSSCALPNFPLFSAPRSVPLWRMKDACLRLQMSGPHNANLISLAAWVATLTRKERKEDDRGEEQNKLKKDEKTIYDIYAEVNTKMWRQDGRNTVSSVQPLTEGGSYFDLES